MKVKIILTYMDGHQRVLTNKGLGYDTRSEKLQNLINCKLENDEVENIEVVRL